MPVGGAMGVGAGSGLQGPKKSSGSKGSVSPTSADEYSVRAKTKNQNHLGTFPPEMLEKIAASLTKVEMFCFRQVGKYASQIDYVDKKKSFIYKIF